MPITAIQNATNLRRASVHFINIENSFNNEVIPPETRVSVRAAWVPWVFIPSDFNVHHIEIRDVNSGTVLFYIWQRNASDGDFVRWSETGFVDPGNRLAPAGGSIENIRIGFRSDESPSARSEVADEAADDVTGVTIAY